MMKDSVIALYSIKMFNTKKGGWETVSKDLEPSQLTGIIDSKLRELGTTYSEIQVSIRYKVIKEGN